jgi:hypothetical protein
MNGSHGTDVPYVDKTQVTESRKLRQSIIVREVCWMTTVTEISIKGVLFPISLLTMMMISWTITALWQIPTMNAHKHMIRS